uniref:Uncharacterized protein n=1 Tax=Coccidioides posadasii RMSCC 3488 TaxID=454284 RepID=A0A0J6FK49_COCPO|nr:hypothetical protein CPAG_07004 [Coccidioides posadasii RMSCC 3488]
MTHELVGFGMHVSADIKNHCGVPEPRLSRVSIYFMWGRLGEKAGPKEVEQGTVSDTDAECRVRRTESRSLSTNLVSVQQQGNRGSQGHHLASVCSCKFG